LATFIQFGGGRSQNFGGKSFGGVLDAALFFRQVKVHGCCLPLSIAQCSKGVYFSIIGTERSYQLYD